MAGLDERAEAFEKKFQHDEATRFKVESRQARLFGARIAAELGLIGEEADAYARGMVVANLDEPGTEDIIRKAVTDLEAAGKSADPNVLRLALSDLLIEAQRQIMTE